MKRDSIQRVLIVDDDETYRLTLTEILRTEGFDVVSCELGQEAVDLVRREQFAVAIVDHRLPDSDGTRVLARISEADPRVRGIIHTAYGSFESARDAVNLGTFAYTEKPCDPQEVIGHVHRAIADRMSEMLDERDAHVRRAQHLESLGRFASGIAHDFNNLLMSIHGYLGVARSTIESDHPAIAALQNVEDAARQARGVTNSLLTFTREGVIRKKTVDLRRLVETSARLLRPMLVTGQRLSLSLPARRLFVDADETQLHQVLMNLALNARDAMPKGGRLALRLSEVSADRSFARLTMADTGCGMDDTVRSRMFEPYYSANREAHGMGLGLSIVHAIVEEHDGTIDVWSIPGRGTRLSIVLPCVESPAYLTEPKPVAGRRGDALVVESNAQVRAVLASMLSNLGFDVVRDDSGIDQQDIDLVVVGLDHDGEREAFDELRRTHVGCPTIILAGSDPVPTVDGPVGVLERPFGLADLEYQINEVLGNLEETDR